MAKHEVTQLRLYVLANHLRIVLLALLMEQIKLLLRLHVIGLLIQMVGSVDMVVALREKNG